MAVVGTGASAIQLIPELAKTAAQVVVFQRTPAWVMPKWDTHFSAHLQQNLPIILIYAKPYVMAFYWGQKPCRWLLIWNNPLAKVCNGWERVA